MMSQGQVLHVGQSVLKLVSWVIHKNNIIGNINDV
jgi:hypothetical protein